MQTHSCVVCVRILIYVRGNGLWTSFCPFLIRCYVLKLYPVVMRTIICGLSLPLRVSRYPSTTFYWTVTSLTHRSTPQTVSIAHLHLCLPLDSCRDFFSEITHQWDSESPCKYIHPLSEPCLSCSFGCLTSSHSPQEHMRAPIPHILPTPTLSY